jgi:hypothetical protein
LWGLLGVRGGGKAEVHWSVCELGL